jgi:ABC-type glycerol-3-phosphate transport system substrate-binding protein
MSHTDSQMEFLLGHAAMIPCGTGLESEMKNKWPRGFHMDFFLAPAIPGGKGDPSLVSTGIETWIVPKQGKHPKEAADFFRYMTSLKSAREFVVRKNTLMAIKGADQVNLPQYLVTPAKYLRQAKGMWSIEYRQWYPTFGKEVEGAISALAAGEIGPQECVRRIEAQAAKQRGDKAALARVPVQ